MLGIADRENLLLGARRPQRDREPHLLHLTCTGQRVRGAAGTQVGAFWPGREESEEAEVADTSGTSG